MFLSIPLTSAALAAAQKPPSVSQQRAFAAGIMAHLAIQTFYRLEHPANFIITERLVTIGDARLTTISKFSDLAERGNTIYKKALKAIGRGKLSILNGNDFYSALVFLLDLASSAGNADPRSKRRFDIIDFGPILTSSVVPLMFAQGYEIKSINDLNDGIKYINTQTGAFNDTLADFRDVLKNMFNVDGLFNTGAMPGKPWPTVPHILPIGPNVLLFHYAAPGVICYEWLKFKRFPIKQLWKQLKTVAEEVRDLFKRESRLSDDIRNIGFAFSALAAVAVAMILWEAIIAAGLVSASLEGIGALSANAIRALTMLAPATSLVPGAAMADSSKNPINIQKALTSIENAYDESATIDPSQFQLADPNTDRSGGTGPTVGEKMLESLINALSDQFIFRFAVSIGQGNELFDDTGIQVAKENLRQSLGPWLSRYLSSYGMESFLNTFGEEKLDNDAAYRIADMLITVGTVSLKPSEYGNMLMHLANLSDDDVNDSLPENYDENAESL